MSVLFCTVSVLLTRGIRWLQLEREQWHDEKQKLAQDANRCGFHLAANSCPAYMKGHSRFKHLCRLQQRGDALEALLTRTRQGVLGRAGFRRLAASSCGG